MDSLLAIDELTKFTASRDAKATMSAHETVALQAASTCVLMASMTSYPRTELTLAPAFFSPVNVGVSSRRMDASQPCVAHTYVSGSVHCTLMSDE